MIQILNDAEQHSTCDLHVGDVEENGPDGLVASVHGNVVHVDGLKGERDCLGEDEREHQIVNFEDTLSFWFCYHMMVALVENKVVAFVVVVQGE